MSVQDTLEMLGIDYEEAGGEYRASCPMHEKRVGRPDSNPSWYINEDSGLSICFSCGYRANLERLIADVRGIDIGQAKALLVDSRTHIEASRIRERITKSLTWVVRKDEDQYLPESSLAAFDSPPERALVARGLTPESCSRYGVMWDSSEQAWILPIRHPWTERLMGWQVKSQVRSGFVRNRPTGVKKARTLFGIEVMHEGDTAWVVESPLDAVRLDGFGYSAVATYGSHVSRSQIDLLSAFDRIVLAFDNDDAGAMATDQVTEGLRKVGADVLIARFPDGRKDPGDCAAEEIKNLEMIHWVRY